MILTGINEKLTISHVKNYVLWAQALLIFAEQFSFSSLSFSQVRLGYKQLVECYFSLASLAY